MGYLTQSAFFFNIYNVKNTPSKTADFLKEKKMRVKPKVCYATGSDAFGEGIASRREGELRHAT